MMQTAVKSVPDTLLFEQIRKGDLDAFSRLYDAYAPTLFGVIHKIIPDNHKAEDALQSAFLDIRNQIVTGSEISGKGISWMLHTARLHALGKRTSPLSGLMVDVPHAALELVYFNGLSVSEAAEKLGISAQETRKQIQRALQTFRHKQSQ